jgi:molybdate transport system substrate-binding protein
LGEADAGIVYRSDVTPKLQGEVSQLIIPQPLNVETSYIIAPLTDSESPTLARAFLDYVLSAEGQQRLAANGLQAVTVER